MAVESLLRHGRCSPRSKGGRDTEARSTGSCRAVESITSVASRSSRVSACEAQDSLLLSVAMSSLRSDR